MALVINQLFAASNWGVAVLANGTATVESQFAFGVLLSGTLVQGAAFTATEQNPAHTVLNMTCLGVGSSGGFVLQDTAGKDYLFSNSALSIGSQETASSTDFGAYVPPARVLDWTGSKDTGFANAANWNDTTNGLNPAASAPGSIDTAAFLNRGGTITGAGNVAALNFGGVTLWDLSSGGSLAASGSVTVGTGGFGELAVTQGASIASQGTADLISGNGGGGVVLVDGTGSNWSSAGELVIGSTGDGLLSVSGQAKASANGTASQVAAVLGVSAGDKGTIDVSGIASVFTATGQLTVGQTGTGNLTVESHGTVQTGASTLDARQGIDIGQAAGGSGDVVVSGSNSLLSNKGRFVVGDAGLGSLSIQSGGTVTTTPGTVAGLAGAVIGAQTGSDGSSAGVTGAGSAWQITGLLQVGDAAAGSLSITSGGSVTAGQFDAGVLTGGSGVLSVIGKGSGLTVTGQFTVGDTASAEVSILNGALVTANNVDVGVGASATGNIDLEGTGSELSVANNVNLGDAGVGVLTLGNNTTLHAAGNVNIGANGVLNQFGGIIDPSVVNNTGRAGGKGSISASVSIANSGTLFAASGTETLTAPVITGSGALEIDSKGDLAVNAGSVVTTQTVNFTDGTGVLTIGTLGGFAATIGDVIAGDSIVVQGTSIASLSFNASTHVLTLFDPSQAQAGVLQFGTSVVDQTLISVNGLTPCFVAGTRISTERGEVAVEELLVGDLVQVVGAAPSPQPPPARGGGVFGGKNPPSPCGRGLGGGGRAQPVVWLGRRTVDCARHPEPRKVWPVQVRAHAFGPGRPSRDLWLSPDHAIFINDVLIPVKHLINNVTIAQVTIDEVTYYHVELPQHSVVLAEGLPAESYLDAGDRANFANGDGPVALHPDFATRAWDAAACAPLVVTGPELAAVRCWLATLATAAPRLMQQRTAA